MKVLTSDEGGNQKEISRVSEGECFGEISLMMSMPRTASIVASEDSLLVSLHKTKFDNFLNVVPELREQFERATKARCAAQFKTYAIPFFQAIPDDLYMELAEICEIEIFEERELLFCQGMRLCFLLSISILHVPFVLCANVSKIWSLSGGVEEFESFCLFIYYCNVFLTLASSTPF